jgi:hypothetical protein
VEETTSYLDHVPETILSRYEFVEVRNAAAIVAATNLDQWGEILGVLAAFQLSDEDILGAGKNKSDVAKRLDEAFRVVGWREGRIDTRVLLRVQITPYKAIGESWTEPWESTVESKGYKVDNFKKRLALDVEWNAKDGNLDRDVGAYRALYDAGLIDAGIVITRTQDDLRQLAQSMQGGTTKFGTTTTTNLEKLKPRLLRGDGGGCPILAIAISSRTR